MHHSFPSPSWPDSVAKYHQSSKGDSLTYVLSGWALLRPSLTERAAFRFLAQFPIMLGHAPSGFSPWLVNHRLKSQIAHKSVKVHLSY